MNPTPYPANATLRRIRQNCGDRLADKIAGQYCFLTPEDVAELAQKDRLCLVLVRCGNGRFLCPAQDVSHFIALIDEHRELAGAKEGTSTPKNADYVRDVSCPA